MGIRDWLERIAMAVTFAEANDEKTARDILRKEKKKHKRQRPRPRVRPRLRR